MVNVIHDTVFYPTESAQKQLNISTKNVQFCSNVTIHQKLASDLFHEFEINCSNCFALLRSYSDLRQYLYVQGTHVCRIKRLGIYGRMRKAENIHFFFLNHLQIFRYHSLSIHRNRVTHRCARGLGHHWLR